MYVRIVRWKHFFFAPVPQDMDRISSLPVNVIDAILKRLSIRDVVRTSILSRAWRDQLSTVSQLVFDKETFPCSEDQQQKEYDNKVARIIDQVLLLHQGTIDRFKLSVDLSSYPDIDRWIRYLSRRGVAELILEIWKGSPYRLPSSFFSWKGITNLKLHRCIFCPPSTFNGFNRLTVLDLQSVITTGEELGRFLSLCPSLRKLGLKYVVGCTTLGISSQELVEFSFRGKQIQIYLESTPLLSVASIFFNSGTGDHMLYDGTVPNIVKLLGNLPSIERLELRYRTLKALAFGDVPVSLPVLFPLTHLYININFEDVQELLAAFCILRSSLVLEKLMVVQSRHVDGMPSEDVWPAQEEFNCNFNNLQIVKMTGFAGTTAELKFIELILANAPLLERMQIQFRKEVRDEAKILRQLLQLQRSSVKAKIVVP